MFMYSFLCMFFSIFSVSLYCSVYCFMCKCVPYYCHRVTTQLQSTDISNR